MVLWIHRKGKKGPQNTFGCLLNTSSVLESVWITFRAGTCQRLFWCPSYSCYNVLWGSRTAQDDTKTSVESPPSRPLLVAPRRLGRMNKWGKSHSFSDVLSQPRLVFAQNVPSKMSYNSRIRIQSVFLSHTHRQKHTHSVLSSTGSLLEKAACATIYPLGEPKLKHKLCHTQLQKQSSLWVCIRNVTARVWPCISDAYLPGCELCGISASAPSTGRTASWTCCCSRRRVSAPSRRTASAPCAGWSWSPHWTLSHRSPTSSALQGETRRRERRGALRPAMVLVLRFFWGSQPMGSGPSKGHNMNLRGRKTVNRLGG